MKKLLLKTSLLPVSISNSTQIINHPESFDSFGWAKKNAITIVLSAGKYSESYTNQL